MSKPAYPIYYIRHGQTDWNAERRFQGRINIDLNETGRAQAKANGQKLKKVLTNPGQFQFLSSPLNRACETMEIILSELDLPLNNYQMEDLLIERSYGDLEGMTLEEFQKANPKIHESRSVNHWDFTPKNGESLRMTRKRITPFLQSISRPSIIVAHGALGRTVRQYYLGISPIEAGAFIFPQDKIFKFTHNNEELL